MARATQHEEMATLRRKRVGYRRNASEDLLVTSERSEISDALPAVFIIHRFIPSAVLDAAVVVR